MKDILEVKLVADSNEQSEKLNKIFSKKFVLENKEYKYVVKNYYYLLSLFKKETDSLKKKNLKIKIDNLKKYLDFSGEKISFFKRDGNNFTFGIGFFSRLKNILKKKNYDFKIVNLVDYPSQIIVDDKNFNRKYQFEAVSVFFKRKYGIIKLPTGSGKTMIAKKAIETYLSNVELKQNEKILFIVEQKDLIFQTKKEFKSLEDNGYTITQYGGGITNLSGQIIIATVQSLINLRKKNFREFKKFTNNVVFYIVDECDMFTSMKRIKFLKNFDKTKFRLFLSATPTSRFDKVKSWRLKELAGNIIYDIKEKDLIENKMLAKQQAIFIKNYNLVARNVNHIPYKQRWQFVYENMIVNNKARNNLILQVANYLKLLNLRSLFIVERKEHCKILGELLEVPYYTGDNEAIERQEAIENLESGKCNIIVSTRIFRRAINIPNLQVLVNCSGYKKDSLVIQTKGRIGRITDSKDCSLYIDFIDYGNKYLEEHSAERMKTIESLKIPIKVFYHSEILDFIKGYFRKFDEVSNNVSNDIESNIKAKN